MKRAGAGKPTRASNDLGLARLGSDSLLNREGDDDVFAFDFDHMIWVLDCGKCYRDGVIQSSSSSGCAN